MSHAIASLGTVYKPADLARHPYFKRTKQRKARWYCSLCGNPSAHFDCAGATRHELTPRHVASLAHAKLASPTPSASKWEKLNTWAVAPADDGWGPAPRVENWSAAPVRNGKAAAPVLDGWGPAQPANDWDTAQIDDGWGAAPNKELNGWGAAPANDSWDAQSPPPAPRRKRKSATPLEDLRNSEAHQVLECQDQPRRTWRIRMWIKELVLAAGGEWIDTEADVEPPMPWNWDDEPRPDLAWGLAPAPGGDGEESEASERAMAVSAVPPSEGHVTEISSFSNFSHPHPWIERMAEKFGWDAATIRDRNNFYTLPMKEKKARVQQMIYQQSPSHARAQAQKLRQPARHQPQPQAQRQRQPGRRRR